MKLNTKVRSALALATLIASDAVLAQNISGQGQGVGQIATNMTTGLTSVGDAILAFCGVAAIGVAAAAAFKFYAYSQDTAREKLTTPFIMLGVAALLFAIPMVLLTGSSTIWGSGAQIQSSSTTR
jgi:hypothetical protein